MEDTTNVTYDDVVQTKNVQILKSIVPFLDVRSQRPAAMLIQYMEMQNAYRTFSRPRPGVRQRRMMIAERMLKGMQKQV